MDKKRVIVIAMIILIFIVAISLSSFYYNDKYSVSFETGTNDVFLTKYVNKNETISEPSRPIKDGYIFVEWQLNGSTYDFNSPVNSDIVLTAKWVKEEYVIINFDTDSEYIIESKKIIKGSTIDNMPVSYKDGYDFIGWMYNGILYNDENIYDDITLVAYYEKIQKYKVGDLIKIIGNYSSSAYNKKANYNFATGWERKILRIFEGAEFPYMIGDDTGVTGFFKEESFTK